MATPTWKYPTVAAATTTIEFSRGDFMRDTVGPVGNVDVVTSEYGEVFSRSMGADWVDIPFSFIASIASASGNEADKADVEAFLATVVGWAARPFYYTDRAGTSRKVKCISRNIWVKQYPLHLEGQVMLRTVE